MLFFIPKHHDYRILTRLFSNILSSSVLTSYGSLLTAHYSQESTLPTQGNVEDIDNSKYQENSDDYDHDDGWIQNLSFLDANTKVAQNNEIASTYFSARFSKEYLDDEDYKDDENEKNDKEKNEDKLKDEEEKNHEEDKWLYLRRWFYENIEDVQSE